ncbi:Peroxisomal N(1)-acetyl-spermine/spermidine oxidase-like [Balamuthia mandrillaris]
MEKEKVVAIIGAGLAGLSCALHLVQQQQQSNVRVVLLEASENRVGGRVCTIPLLLEEDEMEHEGWVELGAHWLHGTEGHPLHPIALEHGLLSVCVPADRTTTSTNEDADEGDEAGEWFAGEKGRGVRFLLGGGGTAALDLNQVTSVLQRYGSLWRAALETKEREEEEDERDSLGRVVRDAFLSSSPSPSASKEEERERERRVVEWRERLEMAISGCDSVDQLSVRGMRHYQRLKGGDVLVNGGFQRIPEVLLAQLQQHQNASIHFGKVVRQIRFTSSSSSSPFGGEEKTEEKRETEKEKEGLRTGAVQVECEDGQVFYADHVVVTVSLGVLKDSIGGGEANTWAGIRFEPELPSWKREAIQRMGFGTVDKVFLLYDEDDHKETQHWWPTDCEEAYLLFPSSYSSSSPSSPSTYRNRKNEAKEAVEEWGQLPWWTNGLLGFTKCPSPTPSERSLWMGWLSGEYARAMERASEEQVATDCAALFSNKNENDSSSSRVPLPKKLMRSRWYSDPQFRGSYSFIAVGSSVADVQLLGAPLYASSSKEGTDERRWSEEVKEEEHTKVQEDKVPRVLFAGEATHPKFFSTTHGAYLSGQREAERLLQHFRSSTQV